MLEQYSQELLRDHLSSHFPQAADHVQVEAAVQYTTAALSGLLMWWVAADIGDSADEVHDVLQADDPGPAALLRAGPAGLRSQIRDREIEVRPAQAAVDLEDLAGDVSARG